MIERHPGKLLEKPNELDMLVGKLEGYYDEYMELINDREEIELT